MQAFYDNAQANLTVLKKRAAELEAKAEKLDDVVSLLRSLSGGAREYVVGTINPLANEAVHELFGDNAVFDISFRQLPKQGWVADIASGTTDRVGNPIDTDGLSMAEVISDAVLRPLVVAIHNPSLNRVVVMDEPFAGVDKERPEALCRFLRGLCDKLGMQIILTSHTFGAEYDQYFDQVITLTGE
jgi:DNA repair exonuclease SbcCD ATPase subunit